MSWDLVVLTVDEPTAGHQRTAFDAWPERIRGEADAWLEEVVAVDGVLRLQTATPGPVEDLDQLRFLELDLGRALRAPVWFTEITVPAAGGREGILLAQLLAQTLVAECGGVWIDRQTGEVRSVEGVVDIPGKPAEYPVLDVPLGLVLNSREAYRADDLGALMAALDRHLPNAYPTRWGWDEPLRKKPPRRPAPADAATWEAWLEEGGALWDGADETISAKVDPADALRRTPGDPVVRLGQSITIEAPATAFPAAGYRDFFAEAVRIGPRNVGAVQAMADTDDGWHGKGLGLLRSIRGEVKVLDRVSLAMILPVLQELPWGMLWGRPYLDLIGSEPFRRLADARVVHTVELLDDDHVWTQLTADPVDIRTDYRAYAAARDRAKEILGADLFLREDWGFDDPRYRAPVFPAPAFD